MYENNMSPRSVHMTMPYPGTTTMDNRHLCPGAGVARHQKDTASPKTRLSVLYVDDEPTFLDLCKIYLERSGDICMTGVSSPYEALELLDGSCFDVIVSDYQMPDLDGIGFLKHLQKINCTIPFILFTGRGREEVVIQAINNGATFYLQKGGDPKSQFAELTHKIKEAARRRQAEKALQESENRYRTVFENTGTAIVIIDEDMTICLSNAEFARLTGFETGEIDGRKCWTEFIADEDARQVISNHHLLTVHKEQALRRLECRLVTKNRQVRDILITVDIIPDTQQSVASLIDITDLKQAEEELKRKTKEIAAAYKRLAEAEEILRHKVAERSPACRPPRNNRPTVSNGT
jgi:PAS domain S-box-containing protein